MKYTKIILLIAGLMISLTSTSYASKKQDKKNTKIVEETNIISTDTKNKAKTSKKQDKKNTNIVEETNIINTDTKNKPKTSKKQEKKNTNIVEETKIISTDTKNKPKTSKKQDKKNTNIVEETNIINTDPKNKAKTSKKQDKKNTNIVEETNIINTDTKNKVNENKPEEIQEISTTKISKEEQQLLEYYQNVWDSNSEVTKRRDILEKLEKLKEIFTPWYDKLNFNISLYDPNNDSIYKNISASNLDFNLLQSILLDYYKFSISFSKYNVFIILLTKNEFIKNTTQYKSFIEKYNNFIDKIKKRLKVVKVICDCFFLSQSKDPENFPHDEQNTSTKLNDENQAYNNNLLNDISETILKLESNFYKIFNLLNLPIPNQIFWYKLFKENADVNNLIDENVDISKLEIIPKQDASHKELLVQPYMQNKIPPHYKLNLHILGTVIKLELIKSINYLKKLINDPNPKKLNDFYDEHFMDFSQNKKIQKNDRFYCDFKKYINKLYCFYNNLRAFIVYCKNTPKADYSFAQNFANKISIQKKIFFPKSENNDDEKKFNESLNSYADSQCRNNDILSVSAFWPSIIINQLNVTNGLSNFFKKYYNHVLSVYTTVDLDKHISKNKAAYNALMQNDSNTTDKIAPITALDRFVIALDNSDTKYFDEFCQQFKDQKNNIDSLKPYDLSKNESEKNNPFNLDFNNLLFPPEQNYDDYSNNQNVMRQLNIPNYFNPRSNQVNNTQNFPNEVYTPNIVFNINQFNILNQPIEENMNIENQPNTPSSTGSNNMLKHKTKRDEN